MSRVNLLFFSVAASLLLPASLHAVRPRVVYTAVSAAALGAGANMGLSFKKRTAAINYAPSQYGEQELPTMLEKLKRERLLYTGGAALLGAGLTAGVAIPLAWRLPAARIVRARTLVAQVKKHEWGHPQYKPKKHDLGILEQHKILLQRAEQEVDGARADYRFNLLKHVPEDVAAAVLKAEISCAAIDVERAIGALSPKK